MRFNPEISYGHIMQLVALIFAVFAGYFQLRADDQALHDNMRLVEARLNAEITMNTMRVGALEKSIEDKLRFIADAVAEIRKPNNRGE